MQKPSIDKFVNLKLKHFTCDTLKWYNLDTSRQVGSLKDKIKIISPRITANSIESIYSFLLINGLSIKDLEAPTDTITKLKAVEKLQKKLPKHVSKGDLDTLDIEELRNLPQFSFSRMWLNGRILNVVDGDTVDIAMSIPVSEMMHASGIQTCMVVGKGHPNIIISHRLRLYAIDTAEKNTVEGQLVKQFSIDVYNETNGKITVMLLGTGARGRDLALIYPRKSKKSKTSTSVQSINQRILEYVPSDSKWGKCAIVYYGKTKDESFTKSHHSLKDYPEFNPKKK